MLPVPDIVMAEGFLLTQRGNGWRGMCPLHDKDGRNPSFVAWETGWKCYSCGESGDGIAFIMKLHRVNFPEALRLLGIDPVKPTAQEKREQARKRKERTEAEWRERELARTLGIAIRRCHEALRDITPETIDHFALILDQLTILHYQHNVLIYGDQADRAELVRDLTGLRLFSRTLLFKKTSTSGAG
jgi:DNA primase